MADDARRTGPDGSADLDPVAIAREVLAREAETLTRVAGRLGDSFRLAVETLESASGRVIVTGVGKSGLIGGKIAATLTSIGSPAFFLHPTEALHGDLGIVGPGDSVLAISRSGRSAELLELLPFLRRLGARIVALVQTADSPLGRVADVVVELGPVEEACSLDLVPTSSTTAALAVGDALAVALLRRRGLTAEDFAVVHPGGVIGRTASRRVADLMRSGDTMPSVPETATLRIALAEIVDKGLGITVLVDPAGELAGVLTDGDLKRILLGPDGDGVLAQPVSRFMHRTPRTITVDAPIAAAVREMETRRPGAVTSLVVVEGSRPVGVLHLHDCLGVGPVGPR